MIEDASPRCRMETGRQRSGVAPYARAGANFGHGGSHPSVPRDPPGASLQRVRSSWRARLLRLEKSHFVKQISVLVHLYRMPCALISKASATFKHQRASQGPRALARERACWPAWRRLLAPRGRASPTVCPGRPISSFPQGESAILIPCSLCLFILRVFDCSDCALTRKT